MRVVLTYDSTALDPVAGIVVGSGHGRQLPVGRRNVSQLVPQVRSTFVQSGAWAHGLIVNYIIYNY